MAPKDKTDESPFQDVSKQAEQAEKAADQPAEFNDDGTLKVDEKASQAANELNEELARRSAATANGGGPFPSEVLQRNFIGNAQPMKRRIGEYTSHEDS